MNFPTRSFITFLLILINIAVGAFGLIKIIFYEDEDCKRIWTVMSWILAFASYGLWELACRYFSRE